MNNRSVKDVYALVGLLYVHYEAICQEIFNITPVISQWQKGKVCWIELDIEGYPKLTFVFDLTGEILDISGKVQIRYEVTFHIPYSQKGQFYKMMLPIPFNRDATTEDFEDVAKRILAATIGDFKIYVDEAKEALIQSQQSKQ